MPGHDARSAARNGDSGMAKITSITWRAGAVTPGAA